MDDQFYQPNRSYISTIHTTTVLSPLEAVRDALDANPTAAEAIGRAGRDIHDAFLCPVQCIKFPPRVPTHCLIFAQVPCAS